MTNTTLLQVRELLLEYDQAKGGYPESEFEGRAVWQFLCERLGVPGLTIEDANQWETAIEAARIAKYETLKREGKL